jgi:hypothetical protein
VAEPTVCPVCGTPTSDALALARHLVAAADASEGRHVMWLNRNVTKHRASAVELEPLLRAALDGSAPAEGRVRR